MDNVRFWLTGNPKPKGSLTPTKWGKLRNASKYTDRWCKDIRLQLEAIFSDRTELFTCPVECTYTFYIERPKTVKRYFPSIAPDLDKLVRAINDAMTGIIYVDDGLICAQREVKMYARSVPGVMVEVYEWDKEYEDVRLNEEFRSCLLT